MKSEKAHPEETIHLRGDHDDEVYRGILYDRANKCRKLEPPLVTKSAPNNDDERGQLYTLSP